MTEIPAARAHETADFAAKTGSVAAAPGVRKGAWLLFEPLGQVMPWTVQAADINSKGEAKKNKKKKKTRDCLGPSRTNLMLLILLHHWPGH